MPGDLVVVKNLNLGGLAKPATALVDKVGGALGGPFRGAFRPMQIRRVAEAEGDSIRILAQADADAAEIRLRAAERVLAEEMRNQANIESTLGRALPHIAEEAEPEKMEDDWIVNFFDKCRIVSDEQMQDVWARILAGEANNPGTFSRKTINILADMDKADAELFATLCRFVWTIHGAEVAPINETEPVCSDHGITIESLTELESLGLIRRTPLSFSMRKMPAKFSASYLGRSVELTLAELAANKLRTGSVILTAAGLQLVPVCQREPVDGFFEYMCELWEGESSIESVEILDDEQLHLRSKQRPLGPGSRPEIRESVALSLG